MAISSPDEVLAFWFPAGYDADAPRARAQLTRWFRGQEETDRAVRERFSDTYEAAVRGELDAWAESPRGRLALVIVLDQFSRNLRRGSPEAYAQDPKVQRLVVDGLARGDHKDFGAIELMFFLVALGHSEDLAMHDLAQHFTSEMVRRSPAHLRPLLEFSRAQSAAHRDVVRRFGRHPARNAVLGRTSTPDEERPPPVV